jgi:hypothetical protein
MPITQQAAITKVQSHTIGPPTPSLAGPKACEVLPPATQTVLVLCGLAGQCDNYH